MPMRVSWREDCATRIYLPSRTDKGKGLRLQRELAISWSHCKPLQTPHWGALRQSRSFLTSLLKIRTQLIYHLREWNKYFMWERLYLMVYMQFISVHVNIPRHLHHLRLLKCWWHHLCTDPLHHQLQDQQNHLRYPCCQRPRRLWV